MKNLQAVALTLRSAVRKSGEIFTRHELRKYCTASAESRPKRRLSLRGLPEELSGALEAIKKKNSLNQIQTGNMLYLVNEDAAKKFAALVAADSQSDYLLTAEINSGLGYLSQELLEHGIPSICMYEDISCFMPNLASIVDRYPGRATFRPYNFQEIWNLGMCDWKDSTENLKAFLNNIERRAWTDEPAVQVIGAMRDIFFIRRLMATVVFRTTLVKFGRMVLHVAMPPSVYNHLMATNEHYDLYRWHTVLFQCLFDAKILGTLPRSAFYPHYRKPPVKMRRNVCRVTIERNDSRLMYVVRIEPKANLFRDNFATSDLAPFYYFLHQHLKSRSSRIIPALEKWVPGCGRTLIAHDFTIFTEFGELKPAELMNLFKLFKSWPEYKKSSFMSSMDTFLMHNEEHVIFDTSNEDLEEMFQFSLDEGQTPLD